MVGRVTRAHRERSSGDVRSGGAGVRRTSAAVRAMAAEKYVHIRSVVGSRGNDVSHPTCAPSPYFNLRTQSCGFSKSECHVPCPTSSEASSARDERYPPPLSSEFETTIRIGPLKTRANGVKVDVYGVSLPFFQLDLNRFLTKSRPTHTAKSGDVEQKSGRVQVTGFETRQRMV